MAGFKVTLGAIDVDPEDAVLDAGMNVTGFEWAFLALLSCSSSLRATSVRSMPIVVGCEGLGIDGFGLLVVHPGNCTYITIFSNLDVLFIRVLHLVLLSGPLHLVLSGVALFHRHPQ